MQKRGTALNVNDLLSDFPDVKTAIPGNKSFEK